MTKSKSGFTIVELLIVIVVIGILAAITIVAYNGFTTRAENTKTINSVTAYTKTLLLYGSDKGSYPTGYGQPCLGQAPKCANTTDGTAPCFGSGQTVVNSGFETALSSYASSLPAPSTQQISCGGKQYAGAWYYPPSAQSSQIYFMIKSVSTCPSVGGATVTVYNQVGSDFVCTATLPAL